MIIVDESDPVGEIAPSFQPRDVTVKKGVDAKEFYELLTEIGRGKFGTVYKCQEKSTGLKLAAKFVPIPKRDDRRNVEREVEIMNSLQHPLIIQLYDAYEYSKMMCVVLELIEGGELFDRVIDDEFVLTERTCTILIRQLCQAMLFVHTNKILHLDLKPENILCLTKTGNRIKVIDFGLARRYDPDKKLQVLFGTPEFVAPEVVNFDRIGFPTDMWSIGVICYVLLSGLSPFMGSTDVETMTNVTIGKYDFDDETFQKVSKESLDFISKLLVKDQNIRMTADQCLEHPWLKQYTIKTEMNEKNIQNVCKINENNISPRIEVVPNKLESDEPQMTSTKENLKSFIERWEEHPNSPYIFDITASLILPPKKDAEKNTSSGFSSRGCSPSPCESLSSNTELFKNVINSEIYETTPNVDNDFELEINVKPQKELFERPSSSALVDRKCKTKQEYLQSFDRRHSDSNYVLNHTSGVERLNLAEEIKKLSDRLMILSSISDELKDFNRRLDENQIKPTPPPTSTNNDSKEQIKCTEIMKNLKNANCLSSSTKNEKIISHLINSKPVTIEDDMATSSNRKTSISMVNDKTDESKILNETPSVFKKVDNSSTKNMRETIKMTLGNQLEATSVSNSSSESTSPCTLNGSVPWPITNRRTKFRVTQLSRDVPIGSPDSHQTIFLKEAANTTKDCLLQLLDKYNGNETRSCNIRRHQSIAVGKGITDNLEYHSMNSINAFFKRNVFQQNGNTVRKIKARIESKHQ